MTQKAKKANEEASLEHRARAVLELKQQGFGLTEIARRLGLSRGVVYRIIKEKREKNIPLNQ